MIVYHGTSRLNLIQIEEEGVTAPSYWGTLEIANEYKNSHGSDGVIISVDTNQYDFEANLQLAEAMADDSGCLDVLMATTDLQRSLDELDSVVCTEVVTEFDVLP